MARKPNYDFERKERERQKNEKKAKRAAEKKEARERKGGVPDPFLEDGDLSSTPPETEE